MVINFRIFSYFCTLGELCFLDGGFLDLVVFGFRFWNLKPSYKFLNKSNYPLPLPLRIKIVCPDFTISTHYTSCFTIKITYQGSTNRNVESRLTFSLYPRFVRQFCPAILSDNFVTKQFQFSIGFIIKSSLLADGPKISYRKSLSSNTVRRLASILGLFVIILLWTDSNSILK